MLKNEKKTKNLRTKNMTRERERERESKNKYKVEQMYNIKSAYARQLTHYELSNHIKSFKVTFLYYLSRVF